MNCGSASDERFIADLIYSTADIGSICPRSISLFLSHYTAEEKGEGLGKREREGLWDPILHPPSVFGFRNRIEINSQRESFLRTFPFVPKFAIIFF